MNRLKVMGIAILALGVILIAGRFATADGTRGAEKKAEGTRVAGVDGAKEEGKGKGLFGFKTREGAKPEATAPGETPAGPGMRGGGGMMGPGNRMAQGLELTDAQKEQARVIFEKAREESSKVVPKFGNKDNAGQQRAAGPFAGLELSDEQKAQMQAIREENRDKMQAIMKDETLAQEDKRTQMRELQGKIMEQTTAILTPEQREKLKTMREGRGGEGQERPQRPQLTDEQRAKLAEINKQAQKEFQAILTPEQRAKAEELRAKMQGMRNGAAGEMRRGGPQGEGGMRQGGARGEGGEMKPRGPRGGAGREKGGAEAKPATE